jgi:phage replication O-like protein O
VSLSEVNPQLEDGFTRIANEIVDRMCRLRLTNGEWLVMITVIRKTYGWGKKEDQISLSQFVEATEMRRPHVCRAISDLKSRKMIFVTQSGNRNGNFYCFNKHFDEWISLPNEVMITQSGNEKQESTYKNGELGEEKSLPNEVISDFVTQSGNESLPNEGHTKETIPKKKTKDSCALAVSFKQFYDSYPKKKNRQEAIKAWTSLNPDEDLLDEILSAIEKQKLSFDWTKEDGKYIPHPASWIRGRRWEDELGPPSLPGSSVVTTPPPAKKEVNQLDLIREDRRRLEEEERAAEAGKVSPDPGEPPGEEPVGGVGDEDHEPEEERPF